jgi:hypothetical protein
MSADPAELWTIQDFAAWLKITVIAARAMLRRRELPPDCVLKIGRRVRLVAAPLRDWAMRRKSA